MKTLSALLSALILVLSPGPGALTVFAQTVGRTVPVQAGGIAPVVPLAQAGVSSFKLATLSGTLALGLTPAALPTVQAPVRLTAPAALSVQVPAPAAAIESKGFQAQAAAAPLLAKPVIAAPETRPVETVQTTLETSVQQLGRAESASEKRSLLGSLFTGARRSAVPADPVVSDFAPAPKSSLLGRFFGKTAAVDAVPTPGTTAKDDSGFNKKAVIALFLTRTLSISCFILTSIAYPFVAGPAVGWAVYGTLMALGPLAAIATGPLNGSLADKLSARNSMVINVAIRALLTLALPAFSYFGVMNFGTLLLSSIANGWVLSATMTTENAYIRRLAGKHVQAVHSLSSVHYVAMQVVLGLLLGIGSFVDKANPVLPFLISAAVHGLVIVPILWFTMPNEKPPAKAGEQAEAGTLKERLTRTLEGAKTFAKKYWKEVALLAAGIGSYFFLHSPLPIAAALFFWVWRSDTVKDLREGKFREVAPREKEIEARLAELGERGDPAEIKALQAEAKLYRRRQFVSILYSGLQAVLTYPLQNFALPLIAVALVGTAGKALLLGKLTGAVFFGNLISNSSQAKLPDVTLPLVGKVPAKRLVQAGVLALAAAWVFTGLVPGSLLAAAAAPALVAGLMALASRLSHRGWIKFLGLGLLAIWLPYFVWTMPALLPFLTVQNALFLTMLVYGMFTGPAALSFSLYQQENTNKGDLGKVFGVSSSFFNTFNSFGYGALSLAAGLLSTAFPTLLLPIGIVYAVAALIFWNAPKRMPGLPGKAFEEKPKAS